MRVAKGEGHGRWSALALGSIAMFVAAPGQTFVLAVFMEAMASGTGVGRGLFSILFSLATLVSSVSSVLLGRVIDGAGLRWAWLVAALGMAVACGTASASTGVALTFVALMLLRSFGQASFPLVSTVLVARSFGRRRGLAMAITRFGLTAALILMPPLSAALIAAFGWRQAWVAIGASALILIVPLALGVRREPRPGSPPPSRPGVVRRRPQAIRPVARLGDLPLPTASARRLLFISAGPPLVTTGVMLHAVPMLHGVGLGPTQAALALSVCGAASGVGTVVAGGVADRLSTRTLLTGMAGLLAAGSALLVVPVPAAGYGSYAILGFAIGLFNVLSASLWPRVYGLAGLGKVQGMAFAAQLASTAVGALPLALSVSVSGSYAAGILTLAGFAVATTAVAARWRDPEA
ncbi:MAG: MFS transporter [bacterium]|nr:MFS transporter [bacterium]